MPGSERSRVTMQDVARHAGVSSQTVSNVVNGRSARVSGETRDRVIAAIAQLGYRVNQQARFLRRGRTSTIGLAIPTLDLEYYSALAQALVDGFARRGWRLVVESTGGAARAEVGSLASSHLDAYDGFVLALAAGEAEDLVGIGTDKPVVLLGERALSSRFDHVVMDNVGGARAATELLFRRGARSIVALGGVLDDEESMQGLRTRGYLDAHAGAGAGADRSLIVSSPVDTEGGYRGARAAIESGRVFDAIFAFTDSSALGALRALADSGRRVPDDVQVIGFDDTRAGRFSVPRLSTVDPDNEARADAVVELMVSRLAERQKSTERRVVMHPATVVERESTRRPGHQT